jgi:hypothetical protein
MAGTAAAGPDGQHIRWASTVFQLDVHNPKAPALTGPVDDLKHECR